MECSPFVFHFEVVLEGIDGDVELREIDEGVLEDEDFFSACLYVVVFEEEVDRGVGFQVLVELRE